MVEEYPHFEKTTFSCYKNEETIDTINATDKRVIIVAGIETHVCVLQTCIDLLEGGFEVVLVTDCCTSRKQKIQILR